MLRLVVFLSFVLFLLTSSGSGLCQGLPGCYPPPPLPVRNPCVTSCPTPPITRTVQVDVHAPCTPVPCCSPMPCPSFRCAQPICPPPPCPTRPARVRVDVVVRPEAPKPCVPQTFCCENPPVFEPIFYQAAALVQSLVAAPLGLGERFMGHPVPLPLPVPTPMPCWRMQAAGCTPCPQPPPMTQCFRPCPPPVRYAQPGPPAKAEVQPICATPPHRKRPPMGTFSR
jgi:hypothetical protein